MLNQLRCSYNLVILGRQCGRSASNDRDQLRFARVFRRPPLSEGEGWVPSSYVLRAGACWDTCGQAVLLR